MKNSEGNASKEALLSDATQLAIRDEVEKRVEQREAIYWKFGGLFVAVIILFFAVLWRVSISEIRETVEKQLAEKEVVKARDRIMAITSAAEDMNRNLIAISSLMNTNQQQFMERLNQIKQQDNLVFKDDVSNLFVSQTGINYDGRKIVLDYEPIPHTIAIQSPRELIPSFPIENMGYVQGKTIIFTNGVNSELSNDFKNGSAQIHYVRKSLR